MASPRPGDSCGSESPKSVLFKGSYTNCKLHSRDFSDCLRYHKHYSFWPPVDERTRRQKLARVAETLAPVPASGATAPVLVFSKKSSQVSPIRIDPLTYLGLDVMLMVFALLDARSLARCGMTSKDWRTVAHSDLLWESKCADLWTGKSHVPPTSSSKFAAYSMSIKDSQRVLITVEELCHNTWEFRFKSTAPSYWLELDPSRRGEAPMRRFFHPDGSHTAPPGDPVWGGHECSYTMVEENSSGDNIKQSRYVRINRWPKMTVSRTPDWGWELNNDFYVYKSLHNAM